MNLPVTDLQFLFSPLCWADHSNVSAKLIRGAPPVGGLGTCVCERPGCGWVRDSAGKGADREEGSLSVSMRPSVCLADSSLHLPPRPSPSFSPLS